MYSTAAPCTNHCIAAKADRKLFICIQKMLRQTRVLAALTKPRTSHLWGSKISSFSSWLCPKFDNWELQGRAVTIHWEMASALRLFLISLPTKIKVLKIAMVNAGPINIIPVLGYVHTLIHTMWHLLKDLPCYTIILGRQEQHKPIGFRKGL